MIPQQQIAAYAHNIATKFSPEKIILFGSYAHGQPTEDSDVDMLVTMPFTGRSVDATVTIRLSCTPPFALDLLIRQAEEITTKIQDGDSFFQEILERGSVLYER